MHNRFSLKIVLLLFSIFLLLPNGAAQVAYHNFNSNDGLPSNEVYCSFQDHDGFLWFGTDHGVVKYNGYNFKTYTTEDGLTDNTVLEIKGDDDNNLWFLTLSGGVCYYNGKNFEPHPNNDTIKRLFEKRLPTSWEILPDKEVWLGFVDRGVAKITIHNSYFYSVKDTPYQNKSTYVYYIRLGRKYVYLSSRHNKLNPIIDGHVTGFVEYNSPKITIPNKNINLFPLGNKLVLRCASTIIIIDSAKNVQVVSYPAKNEILNLSCLAGQQIWLFQKNTAAHAITFSDNGEPIRTVDSFSFARNVSSLLPDRQDNLWLTTLDQGIIFIPNNKIKVYNLKLLENNFKYLHIVSNSKNLFVSLPEDRVLKIDSQLHSLIYSFNGMDPAAASSSITFANDGKPLSNLDNKFSKYNEGYIAQITKVVQMADGNYILGSSEGVVITNEDKSKIFNSRLHNFSKRVTDICAISGTSYILGTRSGLYYLNPALTNKIIEEPYFGNIRITGIKKLNQDIFGVATRGKGVIINIKNKYYKIDEKQGLISNLAEDLYFENDSTIWEASFKGISKIYFRLKNNSLITTIKNYTREDGLCSNQVNSIAGFNGFIWLATNEGLCYFKSADLPEKTTQISLFFDNISVNGTKHADDSLTLSYDENNISIEFNALYYKAIHGIQYKIRLKDIGPWKYTTLNSVQYFSLPPGTYQFEVAAEDADGKYKSDVHTLKFVIKPRFADTALFKILICLLIFIAIALIVSSIFSYQKLKATNVIKLLQSEFKALSYQINPHFIFNVLNSIQYYILKRDTDNAVHLLGSFSLLIRRVVNNSKQAYIGIIEEVECLKEYLDLEKMRLDNKFDYAINIDSSIDIEDKNIIPMIIQPLVENSIWHGIVPSINNGTISIDFSKVNGAVICKVEDNGIGINKAVKKGKTQNNLSLAMKNVSERLKIISELNNSTWAITTTDKSEINSVLSGTIVTIIFPALRSADQGETLL